MLAIHKRENEEQAREKIRRDINNLDEKITKYNSICVSTTKF